MLTEVTLKSVTREDVDRIARWLEDEEVSARWFGHYACGDPVHRGYEPSHMLEASESEWEQVFRHDPRRFIFSIYNEHDEHIGECQVLVDDHGGGELSLLIGRKHLWHRGYGTSTLMELLDQVFNYYRLDRAWVNVPEDNAPALGLFRKLGFAHEATRRLCKRRDGSTLHTCILAMDSREFKSRQSRDGQRSAMPVVTIHGMPGSGSDLVGAEVAGLTGSRFLDDEILRRMCQHLRCSIGELQAIEDSCRSIWSRMLTTFLAPYERFGAFDVAYNWGGLWSASVYDEMPDYLTKERYVGGLKSVVAELALEGNAVLHGHGSNLFVPYQIPALHVFVAASETWRQERVAAKESLDSKEAERWIRKADRESLAIFRNLIGLDLLDMRLYDLIVNLERMSHETAAQKVVGALHATSLITREEVQAFAL